LARVPVRRCDPPPYFPDYCKKMLQEYKCPKNYENQNLFVTCYDQKVETIDIEDLLGEFKKIERNEDQKSIRKFQKDLLTYIGQKMTQEKEKLLTKYPQYKSLAIEGEQCLVKEGIIELPEKVENKDSTIIQEIEFVDHVKKVLIADAYFYLHKDYLKLYKRRHKNDGRILRDRIKEVGGYSGRGRVINSKGREVKNKFDQAIAKEKMQIEEKHFSGFDSLKRNNPLLFGHEGNFSPEITLSEFAKEIRHDSQNYPKGYTRGVTPGSQYYFDMRNELKKALFKNDATAINDIFSKSKHSARFKELLLKYKDKWRGKYQDEVKGQRSN
jgi:hypothetical protein